VRRPARDDDRAVVCLRRRVPGGLVDRELAGATPVRSGDPHLTPFMKTIEFSRASAGKAMKANRARRRQRS